VERGRQIVIASVAAAAVLLSGCSGGKKQAQALPAGASGDRSGDALPLESATTATSVTLPTTVPSTTTTLPPAIGAAGNLNIVRVLSTGMDGEDVKAVEQRLSDLKFSAGPVDGKFDAKTGQAVLSFQKQTGLPRTSKVDAATATRMNTAGFGTPMVADGNPDRVEVDISRQVLQIWRGGQLYRVLGVSTGTGKHYCDTNEAGTRVCGVAVTPTGRFSFSRRIPGQHKSDLGVLYDPVYFTGGYAVHGSPSVPATPASHGCVRIPLWESKFFFNEVPDNTQMIVIRNGAPAVPTLPAPVVGPPPVSTTLPPVTTVPTVPVTTTPTTRPATTTPTTRPATTTTLRPATTTTRPPPIHL
jgi:peptidoglycan hydrolase-like protein with peptidoglycan-binding domain